MGCILNTYLKECFLLLQPSTNDEIIRRMIVDFFCLFLDSNLHMENNRLLKYENSCITEKIVIIASGYSRY